MENVLLDRSSGSFDFQMKKTMSGCRGLAERSPNNRNIYSSSPTYHLHNSGIWSAPASAPPPHPYPRPLLYSSPSLPLISFKSNQPPLLPLPPNTTKYASFPYPCAPPPRNGNVGKTTTTTTTTKATPASRQRDRRRNPRPPAAAADQPKAQRRKPLERATPLPPAPAVAEALDDLEQEMARSFVQDLLHAIAPPPSSLPLPRFSLVVKASPTTTTTKTPPAAKSCNAEASTTDGLRRLLRL